MKKTLAILLSFALVICMIPATAFGAALDNVTINSVTYTVAFDSDSFSYNAKKQVPVVTIMDSLGQAATDVTISYQKGGTEAVVSNPIEAGTYDIYATINSDKQKIGDYIINPISLTDSNIKIVAIKTIDSAAISTISGNNNDGTLKSYFKVTYGTIDVAASNYELSSTISADNKTIYVTAKDVTGKSFTDSSKQDVPFKVISSLSDFTVEKADDSTDFMYTGVRQDPTLKVYSESTVLTKGTDYTVSCTGETKVGDPVTVTVKGIGSYTGETQKTFTIEKFNIGKADITPSTIYVPQNGTSIDFTVKGGNTTLVRGRDYTVAALDTSEAGSKTVTITGQGNYEGTKNVSYTVVDSNSKDIAQSTLTMSNVTYNGVAQAPSAILKIGSNKVDSAYYTVEYSLHDAASYSATKPTNVGVYDVQIKLTTKGITAGYSNGESTDTPKVFASAFEIEPLDIASSTISAVYGGSLAKPVIVKLNGKELARYYDYDVEDYVASKNSYTVKGKGNFTGSRVVYAEIRNISNCTITFSDNRSSVAFGPMYSPKVTVYDYVNGKSIRLYEKTDYEITYKNSKNQVVSYCKDPGTYSVIVTGKSAYTGTKTLTFTINGTDISRYTVTLKESSVKATGYNQTPVIISVKYGNSSSLSSNDYTVTYQDSTGKTVTSMSVPGTYKVVVTGKNGYSGSTYATFRIVGLSQKVTVGKDSYKVYPTSETFKITAMASGEYSGFTYTSSNPAVASVSSVGYVTPKKVGRAVITVTAVGKNKYESASETVEIKVYPKKGYITKKPWTDGKKGQMKVRARYQSGATKYQFRYSRDKNFRAGTYKTKTVYSHNNDKYTTQSTTITGLKRGYTYYFKVRAVYTDSITGDTYYGSWSSWRSGKTI